MDYYKEVLHVVLEPEVHENIVQYEIASRPSAWSKSFSRSERLERNQLRIRRIHPNRIAPPIQIDTSIRPHLQGKEYDEHANDNSSV